MTRCAYFVAAACCLSACGESEPTQPPLPDKVSLPLLVRAEIDGRSQLHIQGTLVWWRHFEAEAPGMWGDDQPTFLNGEPWWPVWPTDENAFCNCDSQKDDVLMTALKSDGTEISLEIVSVRGTASIVQQPTDANAFTAAVEFNDPAPDRDWFEVRIVQN